MVEKTASSKPQSYMIGDNAMACDWRWPDGNPIWRMSYKEGARWYDEDLCEEGRKMILHHFGLTRESTANLLPLDVLKEKSPASLIGMRRELEKTASLSPIEPRCVRIGGAHAPAEMVA